MSNFTTFLATSTLPQFTDLVERTYSHQMDMIERRAEQAFIYEDLTSWGSDKKIYTEVDTENNARRKPQGEKARRARVGVGYSKTMTARRYAIEIEVTWEYRNYARQYATQARNDLMSLSHYVPSRFDLELTHVFTFANATSYTDMDGYTIDVSTGDSLSLVNTAHTLPGSSTTYTNRVSGDPQFSQGALEMAEALFTTEIYSLLGEKRRMKPNMILTGDHPPTCRAVQQLMQSTADVDTNNSGIVNTYKGKYRHLELPNLATTAAEVSDATKKRWWFLVAQYGNPSNSWQSYYGVFEQPNVKSPMEEISTDNWVYGSRGSMGQCTLSAKGLVGSLPTS